MKRRQVLFGLATTAAAVLLPKVAKAQAASYEVVIRYDLRKGYYIPDAQKLVLLRNGVEVQRWKCTSSRTDIVALEGNLPNGFDALTLVNANTVLPEATELKGKMGYDLHPTSEGVWIAIHATLGNHSDVTGSDLCFRCHGFASFDKVIYNLQKQDVVITWRIEHIL